MNVGRAASWIGRGAKRAAKFSARNVVSRPIRATGRGALAGARGTLDAAMRHPLRAAAVAGGIGVGIEGTRMLFGPGMQEMVTGDPQAIRHVAQASAQAVFLEGWDPGDRNHPYAALRRGGDVYGTANYLYGRPIQGQTLGDIRGSRVLGGYGLPPNTGRVRGAGRAPIADGSMVFGMWNTRR